MTRNEPVAGEVPRRVYRPRVDVMEKPGEYVIVAELPGLDPKDVELTVEKDSLTLRARATDEPHEGYKLVHVEYGAREFVRTFVLSDEIERESVRASMKNGILTLCLPKAATHALRQITVEAG